MITVLSNDQRRMYEDMLRAYMADPKTEEKDLGDEKNFEPIPTKVLADLLDDVAFLQVLFSFRVNIEFDNPISKFNISDTAANTALRHGISRVMVSLLQGVIDKHKRETGPGFNFETDIEIKQNSEEVMRERARELQKRKNENENGGVNPGNSYSQV